MCFDVVLTEVENQPHRLVEIARQPSFVVDDDRRELAGLHSVKDLLVLLAAFVEPGRAFSVVVDGLQRKVVFGGVLANVALLPVDGCVRLL